MEGKIKDFKTLLSMKGYLYQVPDKDRATMVRISAEDDILVLSYREAHKKPRTTIIHLMIGQSIKCWEEKHDEKLRELEELEPIVFAYYKIYGPPYAKRNVRDSIIKRKKESLDKQG